MFGKFLRSNIFDIFAAHVPLEHAEFHLASIHNRIFDMDFVLVVGPIQLRIRPIFVRGIPWPVVVGAERPPHVVVPTLGLFCWNRSKILERFCFAFGNCLCSCCATGLLLYE